MNRRAFTLLELIAASVLIGMMLMLCVQVATVTAAARRRAETRMIAMQQSANVMERLAAVPWEQLSEENIEKLELDKQVRRLLSGAKLEIELATPPDEPQAKRITVSIGWSDRTGQAVRPVRVVAWRYRGS